MLLLMGLLLPLRRNASSPRLSQHLLQELHPQTKVIVHEEGTKVESPSNISSALVLYSRGFGKIEVWRSVVTNPSRLVGSSCCAASHSGSQVLVHASPRPDLVDHSILVSQVLQELSASSPISNSDAQTACGGCSSVCLPRPTIYICSSMKIIMWNCQGAAKPSFPHPRAGSREKAIVALMASLIWYARNQRIFQGHFIPPAHLLRLCVYFHKNQFFSSTSFPPGEPTQSRIWGNPQLFLQFYSMNFISWTPPPLGVLTINFDGAVTAERAAGSFIIRNHEGAMLAIGGNLLPAVAVPFAELIEVWLGVKYLFTHLYSQCVWIQGDSSIVITWLKNLQRNRMSLSPWMQDIKI
uniref:Uncharacterized protein LOC105040876 isoform X1 n=1 Tax=Elaeis guineensis var. tenera TaxID=51953 RepID=A0A8N4EX22_ELAGV|nr:uncharacterized protein LOC105040876 isoform X1 [Elaeis guineensis]